MINEIAELPHYQEFWPGLLYLSTLEFYSRLRAQLQSQSCFSIQRNSMIFSDLIWQLHDTCNVCVYSLFVTYNYILMFVI